MTEHPVTPPPELVREWIHEANHNEPMFEQVARTGAAWGADQQLEQVITYLDRNNQWARVDLDELHDAMRPKPNTALDDALLAIDVAVADGRLSPTVSATVRRALEQLDD